MLPQSLLYTILLSLPLLSNTLPVPGHRRSIAMERRLSTQQLERSAARDLSHQQKLAVRALPSTTTSITTSDSTPVVWTSVQPTTPPATLVFYSSGYTFSPTTTSSTTTIPTTPPTPAALPTLPPSVQVASPDSEADSTSTTATTTSTPITQQQAQAQVQYITYNYVAPTKASATPTIVFAAATTTPSYVTLGATSYAIASNIALNPFAALATPTPSPSTTTLPSVFIGTTTYGYATLVAIAPHQVQVGPHSLAPAVVVPTTLPTLATLVDASPSPAATTTTSSWAETTPSTFSGAADNALASLVASIGTTIPIVAAPTVNKTGSNVGVLNYYSPSVNPTACNLTSPPSNTIVLSSQIFNSYPGSTSNPNLNPICGQSVSITYGTQTLTGIVGDSCDNCGEFDLGVSQSVFEGLGTGNGQVQWSFL